MVSSEIRSAYGDLELPAKKKNWYQKFHIRHLILCLGLVSVTFFFYLLGSGCYFAALILVLWAVVVMLMYFHFFQSESADDFDYYGKPRTCKSKLLRMLSKGILKNDAYQEVDKCQSKVNSNAEPRGKHGRTYAKIKNERHGNKYRTNPRGHSSGPKEFKEVINGKPIHIHLPETVRKSMVRVNEKDCIEITNLNKGKERIFSSNDPYYIKDKKRKHKHYRSPRSSPQHKRHYYDYYNEIPPYYDRPKHTQKYPRNRPNESPKRYRKYETDLLPTRDLGSRPIKPDEYTYNKRDQPYSSQRFLDDYEQETMPTRDVDSITQKGNIETASQQQLRSTAVTEPEDKYTNQNTGMPIQQGINITESEGLVKNASSSESNKLKKESRREKNKNLKKVMSDENKIGKISSSSSKTKKCKICCKALKKKSDESACWEILPKLKPLKDVLSCSKKSSKSSKSSTYSNISSNQSRIHNPRTAGYPPSTSQVGLCTFQQNYNPYNLPPHITPPTASINDPGNLFLIEELEKLRNEIIVRKECICSNQGRGAMEQCNMKHQNQRLISLLRDIIDENAICQCPNIKTELKALEQQMTKDSCAAMNEEIQRLLQKLNTKCAAKCASGIKKEKKDKSTCCIKQCQFVSTGGRKCKEDAARLVDAMDKMAKSWKTVCTARSKLKNKARIKYN